jgi:hypothetical protein
MKSHVDILRRTLLNHMSNAKLMADYAAMVALDALIEILPKALEVIL